MIGGGKGVTNVGRSRSTVGCGGSPDWLLVLSFLPGPHFVLLFLFGKI